MKIERCFKVCAFSYKSLTPVYFYFKGESKVKVLNTLNIWYLKQDWLFIVAPYGRTSPQGYKVLSTRQEVTEKLKERLIEINFVNTAFSTSDFRESITEVKDEKDNL